MAARVLLTVTEAAEALGCSDRHVKRLIHEADANRKSRWRWGRELIDLAPLGWRQSSGAGRPPSMSNTKLRQQWRTSRQVAAHQRVKA